MKVKMRIKKIKLENIRSYLKSEINFPEGSLLLSGNIGSGKSTILLALEFALFGLKGSLDAASILRNGKNSGSVELHFSITENEIIIKRTLKRVRDRIENDYCEISINDKREVLSASELRQRVIELIDYPQEFLTKGRGLIYRYTVYTPQEEMKQILVEKADERLNTIRRVFGIDKYKTIIENSDILSRKLREEIIHGEGEISDLRNKVVELNELIKEKSEVVNRINNLKPNLDVARENVNKVKSSIENFEGEIKKFYSLREDSTRINTEMSNILKNIKEKEEKLNLLIEEIKKVPNELYNVEQGDTEKLNSKENEIALAFNNKRKEILEIEKRISSLKTIKMHALNLKSKLLLLNVCPECGQEVTLTHREEVTRNKDDEINKCDEELGKLVLEKDSFEKECEKFENELLSLKSDMEKLREILYTIKGIDEKKRNVVELEDEIVNLKFELERLNSESIIIGNKLLSYSDLEKNYDTERGRLDSAMKSERALEIELTELSKNLEIIDKQIQMLKEELMNKEKVKKTIERYRELREWVNGTFVELLMKIESSVMSKLYTEFNQIFQKWFSMLVDDENLLIRLDADFSPIVEQNGYEIDYSYLSGGERTAAALAYRLALNQVINSLISRIKTRDLLILDEPTDGFSYEQLDKMRDVLRELQIAQLIIVSHEPKIESFVDNIIRFEKEGHVTRLIQ